MRRKLVRQGKSTLTVSLPKKWIEKNELNEDNDVEIQEIENILQISLDSNIIKKNKEIELFLSNEHKKVIKLILRMLYKLGYHKIKLNYNDENTIKKIKRTIRNHLIGFEITNFSNTNCIIENITEPTDTKIEKLKLRIFHIISNCFELLIQDLKNANPYNNEQIINSVESIDRYSNFCLRSHSQNNDNKMFSLSQLYTFLILLSHSFRYLYENSTFDNNIDLRLLQIVEKNKNLFNKIKKGYFSNDITLINSSLSQLYNLLYENAIKLDSKNFSLNYFICEIIKNTYYLTGPTISLIMLSES